MSTGHVLLGLLVRRPQHGYELKQTHDSALPRAKPLAFGQVYATLGRLERDGLVVASGPERSGGPDRTSYALTDAGWAALRDWLAETESPAPYVNSALLAKVIVALLAGGAEPARAYLIAQRRAHVERMRELTAVKADRSRRVGEVVAADFALAHLDADLRWLSTTLTRVADLYQEVTQ